jgi:Spy/CpxP family protein refolding chaperone
VNSWKVILATMVIFGAGVITGGLLVNQTSDARKPRANRPAAINTTNASGRAMQNNAPAQMQRMEFLVRANRELDLTPEQRQRIERILREGQERTRQLWETISPDMRKELQLVRERIKVELTPEQRRHFEELMRRPLRPPGNPDESLPRERLRQNPNPVPESAPVEPR